MGSRGIYHDGWMASAFGPRTPWVPGKPPGIADWTPDQDVWELYHLDQDWAQAHDLAAEQPDKLAQMKETFSIEAARNSVYPVGGGLWVVVLHPEMKLSTPYREWNFTGDITRVPEPCAPELGRRGNLVTIDLDIPDDAHGVLYKLGGTGGGLTCYVDDGYLCYEYNMFNMTRTKIRSGQRLAAGPTTIQVETTPVDGKPAGPLTVALTVKGEDYGSATVPVSVPLLFGPDCLDIGICLGGPASLDYYDRAPFPFNGHINNVNVRYTQ
jgi:arylsulfatase